MSYRHPRKSVRGLAGTRHEKVAAAVVGAAMIASASVLLHESRDDTIRGDSLGYAARLATDSFPHAVLHSPPNKYLIALPLIAYDAMFNAFGLTPSLPYRLGVISLVLLCAGLFFVLARRRVGGLLAIPPTLLLLFFGSGWETLITSMRIPSLIAVACGLGSLIVLRRRDRRGDAAAALLLGASMASHPIAISFVAAATVLVAARPGSERWRSAWLLAVPAAVFVLWWLFFRSPSTEAIFPTGPGDVARFAADSWTTITAETSGLAGILDRPVFDQVAAQVAGGLLLAVLVGLVASRAQRVPPSFWAALAALLVLLVTTRLAPSGFVRSPEEVRYQYAEGVLFLLLLIELVAMARARAWAAWTVSGLLLLGLVYNVDRLADAEAIARTQSQTAIGQYSAYEIAKPLSRADYQPPGFVPSSRDYLKAAAEYGSVADAPADLRTAPLVERMSADAALAGSLGIAVHALPTSTVERGPRPKTVAVVSGQAVRDDGCTRLEPNSGTPAASATSLPLEPNPSGLQVLLRVQEGLRPVAIQRVAKLAELKPAGKGLVLQAQDVSDTAISVGRFAEPPTAQLPRPPKGRVGLLRLPPGGLTPSWRVVVASNKPVKACGLGAH